MTSPLPLPDGQHYNHQHAQHNRDGISSYVTGFRWTDVLARMPDAASHAVDHTVDHGAVQPSPGHISQPVGRPFEEGTVQAVEIPLLRQQVIGGHQSSAK